MIWSLGSKGKFLKVCLSLQPVLYLYLDLNGQASWVKLGHIKFSNIQLNSQVCVKVHSVSNSPLPRHDIFIIMYAKDTMFSSMHSNFTQ